METGDYYFNNAYTGKFLHRSGNTTVNGQSGLLSSLGESSIKWHVTNLEDGYCTIQRADMPNAFLAADSTSSSTVKIKQNNSETISDIYKWEIRIATGGGCLIKSKYTGKYLYSAESSSSSSSVYIYGLYSSGSASYDKQRWRVVEPDEYKELTNGVSFNDLVLEIDSTKSPSVNKSPSDALWASYSDFDYTVTSGGQCVTYNSDNRTFTGIFPGTASIRATHKVTGISRLFNITVECPSVVIPCLYGKSDSYSEVVSFPVRMSPYIEEYSDILNGAVWYCYENGVIEFDSQNMTVKGIGTGYAWIEAQVNGETVLICDVYVDDILKDFGSSIKDYLYLNSTIIGTMSRLQYEQNPDIDPLLLRTEWFLYAIEMSRDGESDTAIRNGLNQKFGLNIADNELFRMFISEVELGARGGYTRENLRLSFDGLRFLLNYYWFQYAAYSITTLDTVNVYTPATVQDVIAEKEYARNLCKQSRDKTKEIQQALTNNPSKDYVVLGTDFNGVKWNEVGESIGAKYFYGESFNAYNKQYPFETFAANKCFLQDALYRGNTIYCSHDPSIYFDLSKSNILIDSSYAKELKLIYEFYTNKNITISYGSPEIINGVTVWKIILN